MNMLKRFIAWLRKPSEYEYVACPDCSWWGDYSCPTCCGNGGYFKLKQDLGDGEKQ